MAARTEWHNGCAAGASARCAGCNQFALGRRARGASNRDCPESSRNRSPESGRRGAQIWALSQNCLFEAKSENRVLENQELASPNFPVFGNLRQSRNSILWEIQFDYILTDIFDACIPSAPSYFTIFPSLMLNPSQDYIHLKQRRADIESSGYRGLRVPSS